jgi:hypothetical protein
MIEANPLLEERLNATGFDYAISLVGDENKQVGFQSIPKYTVPRIVYSNAYPILTLTPSPYPCILYLRP